MGYVEAVLEWLETLIDSLRDYASSHINLLWDWVFYLNSSYEAIKGDLSDLADDVSDIPSIVRNAVDDAKGAILSAVNGTYIIPLSHYVDALKMDVVEWIEDISSDISDIREGLVTVFDFIGHIDGIIDARIVAAKKDILVWIEDKFISIVEHVLEQEVKE